MGDNVAQRPCGTGLGPWSSPRVVGEWVLGDKGHVDVFAPTQLLPQVVEECVRRAPQGLGRRDVALGGKREGHRSSSWVVRTDVAPTANVWPHYRYGVNQSRSPHDAAPGTADGSVR